MEIKTIEIAGLASALEALRLPYGKDVRSEIHLDEAFWHKDDEDSFGIPHECPGMCSNVLVNIDPKDMTLLSTLIKRGDEHAKVVRGIVAYAKITAPIYFYRELETYRYGRERLACESTMHIDCKGLSGEELQKAKAEMPMGKEQRTVDMFSYQTLRRIYIQRKGHRLPEWKVFLDWIEGLPFAKELILASIED